MWITRRHRTLDTSIKTVRRAYSVSFPTRTASRLPQQTDLLERYRSLVTLGRITHDEQQIRIVMQVRRTASRRQAPKRSETLMPFGASFVGCNASWMAMLRPRSHPLCWPNRQARARTTTSYPGGRLPPRSTRPPSSAFGPCPRR